MCGDQVMVTVWKREAEKAEVQELGYLSVLQQCEPTHTFRHDLNTFKAQGITHTRRHTHETHRHRERWRVSQCFRWLDFFVCNASCRQQGAVYTIQKCEVPILEENKKEADDTFMKECPL